MACLHKHLQWFTMIVLALLSMRPLAPPLSTLAWSHVVHSWCEWITLVVILLTIKKASLSTEHSMCTDPISTCFHSRLTSMSEANTCTHTHTNTHTHTHWHTCTQSFHGRPYQLAFIADWLQRFPCFTSGLCDRCHTRRVMICVTNAAHARSQHQSLQPSPVTIARMFCVCLCRILKPITTSARHLLYLTGPCGSTHVSASVKHALYCYKCSKWLMPIRMHLV